VSVYELFERPSYNTFNDQRPFVSVLSFAIFNTTRHQMKSLNETTGFGQFLNAR